MKKFFVFIFTTTILTLSPGTTTLCLDSLQPENLKGDFNIVLITIDALRADHLSCYGYHRQTSPHIDKIAEKGILFKNTIAPSSWTVPSMVSLFTSLYPSNHGAIHGIEYGLKTQYEQEVFSDKIPTLAEILKAQGYTTFGVAANLHLRERFGFARGFDHFQCVSFSPANVVNQAINSWEEIIKKSNKFFIWAHYFDPHCLYHARSPWIEQYTSEELTKKFNLSIRSSKALIRLIPLFKENPQALSNLLALYDSEINYVDSHIGELIKTFELDKNTLIIITSDHGEEFLEHGNLEHGNNLYQETTHIPLIVKLPHTSKKQIVTELVSLVDIMPSILYLLDIPPMEQMLGKCFWKRNGLLVWIKNWLLRKEASTYIYSELDVRSVAKAIVTPEWKYIYNYQDNTEQLYNIRSDPRELNNVNNKNINLGNRLKEQLFQWVANSKKYSPQKRALQLSPAEKEKLKGLGYIQ